MDYGTFLFGFDLAAIAVSLWKLVTSELFPLLNERAKRLILALLMAAVVLIVGLQVEGYILPVGAEPIINLMLTTLTAFLVTMGYGENLISTVGAMADLVKLSAMYLWVSSMNESANDDVVVRIAAKYRLK